MGDIKPYNHEERCFSIERYSLLWSLNSRACTIIVMGSHLKKKEEEEEEKIRISGFRALESLSTEEMNLFILQGRAFRIRNAKWTVQQAAYPVAAASLLLSVGLVPLLVIYHRGIPTIVPG